MRNEEFPIGGNSPCFLAEWQEFYSILSGNAPHYTEEEIIAPVFILNAMVRSMESGKEEPVNGFTI